MNQKERTSYFFLFLALVASLSLVAASYEIGEPSHSIDLNYGPETPITGWVNLSFNDQASDILFKDNEDHSINLSSLLAQNTQAIFECDNEDCNPRYTPTSPEATKSFTLNAGESKVIGLNFNLDITDIDSVSFEIVSNAQASCVNQINVDFFEDGIIDKGNNKSASGTVCPQLKTNGCFEEETPTSSFNIREASNKHCQKLNFTASPGFNIGADIQRNGDTRDLTMALYELSEDIIGDARCDLPSSGDGELSCGIDFFLPEQKEYYLCIFSDDGDGTATIQGYSDSTMGCGFYWPQGNTKPNEDSAFNLFLEPKSFGAVGTLEITNDASTPSGDTLSGQIKDYIIETYGDLDCSAKNCVVPIKISSTVNQDIVLRSLKVMYTSAQGPTTTTQFYDVVKQSPRITSDFQKIYLDKAGFLVDNEIGSSEFSLDLDGDEIFGEEINIVEVPKIGLLNPMKTFSSYPTTFKVGVVSENKVVDYMWDFGDGTTRQTTENHIEHAYSQRQTYDLKVTVTDNETKSSSKTFIVNVTSPKDAIQGVIAGKRKDLEQFEQDITAFDLFTQNTLRAKYNLENVSTILDSLEEQFNAVTEELEYDTIMQSLIQITIPQNLQTTEIVENIPVFPDTTIIDLTPLSMLSTTADDLFAQQSQYKQAIISWNQKNVQTIVSSQKITDQNEGGFVKTFMVSIRDKGGIAQRPYLFIKDIQGLNLQNNDTFEKVGSYYYKRLEREDDVSFSTTADISFDSLPAYISPDVAQLSLSDVDVNPDQTSSKKWLLFILALFLLFVVGIVFYIILQKWYEKRYESYLFKNKNDLFNIMNYIENSKRRNVSNKDIKAKLKKVGWNSEQITYALKKYEGRRTGMVNLFGGGSRS